MSALMRCLLCGLLSFAWAASQARADANAEDAKQARALFEQGVAQADAEHWSEAAGLFQRALALRDSPVIRFNLASATAELGKLTEAVALLRALEHDSRTSAELLQRVARDRTAIERRLANLTVRVETAAPEWRVLLDERELTREQVGVPLALDPKLHYLSLRAGERVLDDEQVELAEGEARELLLEGKVPPPVVVAPQPKPLEISIVGFPREDRDDGKLSKRKRRVLWGVGAAAVAVAAGVVAGVTIARKDDPAAGSPDAFSPGRIGVRVPE